MSYSFKEIFYTLQGVVHETCTCGAVYRGEDETEMPVTVPDSQRGHR